MAWFKTFAKLAVAAAPMVASQAYASDVMIEGAKLCTKHLPRYEREYAIPTHLLSAIATTESGRYHEGLGMKLPWPWSINANGKGYWFETKEEAIAAVKRLHSRGIKSIDVGCMQVNLYHHPEAFASLQEAFEPQTNIAYAATFLHNLHSEGGTWKKAAGDYHSRTPSLGAEYVNLVYNSWYRIIDKLRAARLAVPESSVAAMKELKDGAVQTAQAVTNAVKPKVIRVASVATPVTITSASKPMLAEQRGREVAPYKPARMNSISISNGTAAASDDERRRSLIVVRSGDSMAAPTEPASAAQPQSKAEITSQPQMAASTMANLAPSAAAPQPVAEQPVVPIAIPAKSALVPGAPQAAAPQVSEYKTANLNIPEGAITRIGTTKSVETLPELKPVSYNPRRPAEQAINPQRNGPNFIFND